MTAAPWAITTPDHWQAIVSECNRRDDGWADEIRKAGHSDRRGRLIEARNADMAHWHIMAVLIARHLNIPTEEREEITGYDRPHFPEDREGWLALIATARRARDKAADREHQPLYRHLTLICRWAHLYVHVWALPRLDMINAAEQRTAA
jgi:hypothetical protein